MESIEDQIDAVQQKIDVCTDAEERKLLMKEKEQLREERLILLRQGADQLTATNLTTFLAVHNSHLAAHTRMLEQIMSSLSRRNRSVGSVCTIGSEGQPGQVTAQPQMGQDLLNK